MPTFCSSTCGAGGSAFRPEGLQRLFRSWRKLAADEAPRPKVPAPRVRQRAEDRLGPDGVFRLCANYEAGRPSTALVRSYGLSKGAELRLLEVSGISRRHRGLTETHVKEAVEWYLRGWPLTRIGDYSARTTPWYGTPWFEKGLPCGRADVINTPPSSSRRQARTLSQTTYSVLPSKCSCTGSEIGVRPRWSQVRRRGPASSLGRPR
jgi:hypothetical protein